MHEFALSELEIPVDLDDDQLVRSVGDLSGETAWCVARLLVHLAEFDRRRLYADLGYSSMYEYCAVGLNMSESEAYLRIRAARVCLEFPIVAQYVSDGRLHLSGVRTLGHHLNGANHIEMLEACIDKRRWQIEEYVAEHTGRPKVAAKPVGRVVPIGNGQYEIRFTVNAEFVEKLREVQALQGAAVTDNDLPELMSDALELKRRELRKKRCKETSRPHRQRRPTGSRTSSKQRGPTGSRTSSDQPRQSRYIKAEVVRAVWKRDQSRCTWTRADGKRCNARAGLEIDHIKPYAYGGEGVASNLRLLCRAHNQLEARRRFGGT